MARQNSLSARIAAGAAAAAAAAALIAAIATSALAGVLLQRAEDRRLHEAAVILADELDAAGGGPARVAEVVAEELVETEHTGISFAVLDAEEAFIAGNPPLQAPADDACATQGEELRACRVRSTAGLTIVAAAAHNLPKGVLSLAALISVLLAAVAAWAASRPLSRRLLEPLEGLRSKLARLDPDQASTADLGPPEDLEEIDDLRTTIQGLLGRVDGAIEQVKRFAANAAHELRTPLTSIRAELELLLEAPALSPDARKNIERTEQKAHELTALVERLLVLAMPDQNLERSGLHVSLGDLIADLYAELPPDQQLRLDSDGSDAVVVGDSVLLSSLLNNAVSNALEHGEEVRVRVTIAEENVVLTVSDDGPGVAAEFEERVFEPFFRVQGEADRGSSGRGIGLALVRHVAHMHGGQARFAAREGGWTTLEVRLPRARGSAP